MLIRCKATLIRIADGLSASRKPTIGRRDSTFSPGIRFRAVPVLPRAELRQGGLVARETFSWRERLPLGCGDGDRKD
jgi:hypothetical protein